METLMYIWEVLCQIWPIALIMGFISIPLLWIWFNEDSEYESLDDYYNPNPFIDNAEVDPIDGHKPDLDK